MMRSPLRLALAALLLAAGCAHTAPTAPAVSARPDTLAASYTVISDALAGDPALEALAAPYRRQVEARVAEVLGTAAQTLTEGSPEGSLGNFAAEAMLAAAAAAGAPANMALTNNGGLRVPIFAGPVTVGDLYELMPFENMLVVLTLSGVGIDSLAQQIAREGGEPVAGLSFVLDGRRAREVRIGGRPLDPAATYRVATSDYLAGGGADYTAFDGASDRQVLSVTLRDAFIQHVRRLGTLTPVLDGRIRNASPPPNP